MLRIARECDGSGSDGVLLKEYSQLFMIARTVADVVQDSNNIVIGSELPLFIQRCIFSQHYKTMLDFSLENQIHKTLKDNLTVLYQQRNVDKVKQTIYSNFCGLIESLPGLY